MPPYEPVSSTTSPSTSDTLVAEIQRSALLLADGQSAEAVQRLEALSAAVPAYATSQVLLAKAYEAEQRWEDALEAWHHAHFLAPGSPLVQRERRRLVEAKARAAEAALPPELPPEIQVEEGAEGGDKEEKRKPDERDGVAASEMAEPTEELVEEQQKIVPDEAKLDSEMHDVAELSDSEELPEATLEEAPPEEALPEVFVDASAPVSDALGTEIAEPIGAEFTLGVPYDEAAAEGDDTGWAVVSETETARTEGAVIEAQVAAPMGEPPLDARTETEYIPDAHVVGADATPADDLDSLIRELEDAPRIRPDPNFVGEDVDEGFDDEIADDMVSETLARIYVAQGQFGEAESVYKKLAEQHPEQAKKFRKKAADVRTRVGG